MTFAGIGRYEAVVLAVVVVVGGLLSLVFRGVGNAWAIAASGLVALVVQPAGVLLARLAPGNLTARMGLGAMLRMFTLILYAVVVASARAVPLTAALVSLASFYFVSTLIEPLLIRA